MNILLLERLARELDERLRGATVGTATWYSPVLSIPVKVLGRWRFLTAIFESPGPICFYSDSSGLAGTRPPQRLGVIKTARINRVTRNGDDRVLRFDLDRDEAEPVSLVMRLFGAQGQAAVTRGDTVLESLGARSRAAGSGKRPASLATITASELREYVTAGRFDAASLPGADPAWLTAFAGDTSSTGAADGAEVDVDALASFRDAFLSGDAAFDLVTTGSLGGALPVPPGAGAPDGATRFGPFENAAAAVEELGRVVEGVAQERIVARLSRPLQQRITANEKLVRNLERDIERARGHDAVRREAEILAAYQSTIPPGQKRVTLDDIYEPGREVTITLDPQESIHVQVEKRFKKATKLQKSEEHATRRLELVRRELRELGAALELLAAGETFVEKLKRMEAIRTKFDIEDPSERKRPATRQEATRTLRTFDVDERWFVWVGRNNHENDEITFRLSSPGDYWFHAQGVPGSHVVLRSRGGGDKPSKAVIEATASIAAHFSKARHSELVPVIYTQRRYVRKFRGAKPGQVRCERETMVMVPPQLPSE